MTRHAHTRVTQTASTKLQQRAIQENPTYDEIVNLGISQEQAKKKAAKMPDGEKEAVNRVQSEHYKPKSKQPKQSKTSYGKKDKTKDDGQCDIVNHIFAVSDGHRFYTTRLYRHD